MQLTVTSSDPQDAYDILNAVLVAYPKAAVYLVSNPAIEIRQEPAVPTQPINQYTVQRSWRDGAVKGAVIGYLILRPFLSDTVYGIIFGGIAGIMVYIAIEELIPMAREYDKGNSMILGCIAGMVIMAISLIMFM